jgi:DNA-directed RNA polymerase subunit beta'
MAEDYLNAEFDAIRIRMSSPDQIRAWSYGEVTRSDTINYKTLRPEMDGLFCERIFGPTRDWECYCGKYTKPRNRGVICDRCGVEVERRDVRRRRMGHIELASPCAHVWFTKSMPGRMGLLLDIKQKDLESVLGYQRYMVVKVDSARISEHVTLLEGQKKIEAENAFDDDERKAIEAGYDEALTELLDIGPGSVLSDLRYEELCAELGEDALEAGMGASAALELLRNLDIEEERRSVLEAMAVESGGTYNRLLKRLNVIEEFRRSDNKPEWMVFQALPVMPAELRPMIQMEGGRFASSDLNDLYRRIVNRNNRLKNLLAIDAPDIILRNERRMLQEAVNALIDNGKSGNPVSGRNGQKLRSIGEMLRGKPGRFRQNLLGKRVDFSGRSVIVVGPELKMNECGLPRSMALELFKPFVRFILMRDGHVESVRGANRLIERGHPTVWDALEEAIRDRPVLLNRAPTLHRLGLQAFQPVLIEGNAIRLHPLVTTAFNADFDGDQMAVHLPLSRESVNEAKRLMYSTRNMLSPSSGDPIVSPTLDIVLGIYYLTQSLKGAKGEGRSFADLQEAMLAYELELLHIHALVDVRVDGEMIRTTPGRIIFNGALHPSMDYVNDVVDKKALGRITMNAFLSLDRADTARVLDNIKDLGFYYASKSGVTIAINDVEVPGEKAAVLAGAEEKVSYLEDMFQDGLVTEKGRYDHTVKIWTDANDEIVEAVEGNLDRFGSKSGGSMENSGIGLYIMAASGAKGNIAQIKQMAGMRGLMANPHGKVIERPIKASFREGLSVLEYFISTHGARKGLTDTALRTADSGYMTRRLIDVAQSVVALEHDCGTDQGWILETERENKTLPSFSDQAKSRYAAQDVYHPDGWPIVLRNDPLTAEVISQIEESGLASVAVRSPLKCSADRGVCRMCYGLSLATNEPLLIGEAVGIIAAQSIGEPGTQLTMRTFHTGGIAGTDITSGLPRVNELFEARPPKGESILSETDGTVELVESLEGRCVRVVTDETVEDGYDVPQDATIVVADGDSADFGDVLWELFDSSGDKVQDGLARVAGTVVTDGEGLLRVTFDKHDEREYPVPASASFAVADGDEVKVGDSLTVGSKDPAKVLELQGEDALLRYIIDDVQNVYRSQGVETHDKHIEIIASQMMRMVEVVDPGDSEYLPEALVGKRSVERANRILAEEGKEPAVYVPRVLGITKAASGVESFLSAASFQETTRVLTDAATRSSVDRLEGIKENVIIGKFIPARLDLTRDGRKFLGIGANGELL